MARDFGDVAPYRIRDGNERIYVRQREAGERIYVVLTNLVIDAQETSPTPVAGPRLARRMGASSCSDGSLIPRTSSSSTRTIPHAI